MHLSQEEIVYKILTMREWEEIEQTGVIVLSELDKKDGFVHLSTPAQLLETCQRYFPPETQPLALEIRVKDIEASLRWECVSTRNNQSFPHLYRQLQLSEVIALQQVAFLQGRWVIGERKKRRQS